MSKKETKNLSKTPTKKQHNYASHNKKIAKLRSDEWQKNLSIGRFKAMSNPSKLRQARLNKGMNQQKLITSTPINSISSYSRIEKGIQSISKDLAKTLATRVGCSIGDIFTMHKDKKSFIAKF